MSKNKLYTLSYFKKRLIENKYNVSTLISNGSESSYVKEDIRKWTIIINPNVDNILCTCMKKSPTDFWFKLSCRYNDSLIIKTMSIDSFINNIRSLIIGPNNVVLSNDKSNMERSKRRG